MSSFRESFISSGRQGGGTAVLGDGSDTETGETCVPASLNINNSGKAAELHLLVSLSSAAGAVPNLSLQIISHKHLRKAAALHLPHRLLLLHSPHQVITKPDSRLLVQVSTSCVTWER
jgi:hypothetical protein